MYHIQLANTSYKGKILATEREILVYSWSTPA